MRLLMDWLAVVMMNEWDSTMQNAYLYNGDHWNLHKTTNDGHNCLGVLSWIAWRV